MGASLSRLRHWISSSLREGVNRKSDSITHANLPHKATNVGLYRAFVDPECPADLAIRLSCAQQDQHLLLPFGEVGRRFGSVTLIIQQT